MSNNILDFPVRGSSDLQIEIGLLSSETADLALAEFIKLIDKGYDEAFTFVGIIYEFGGRNVERDYSKAMFYYEKAVERIGSVAAYLGLIRIYYYGLGVHRDYCKALEYCEVLSEDLDHPYANFYIGRMYMEGYCLEKNMKKAKEYFSRSWKKGYVFALTYLGFTDQKTGHSLRGWIKRIKAGIIGYSIASRDIEDPRIHEL